VSLNGRCKFRKFRKENIMKTLKEEITNTILPESGPVCGPGIVCGPLTPFLMLVNALELAQRSSTYDANTIANVLHEELAERNWIADWDEIQNKPRLVDGNIPANTKCPYKDKCGIKAAGECRHLGKDHPVAFSCASARAYKMFKK
jgi:hypothetical protein